MNNPILSGLIVAPLRARIGATFGGLVKVPVILAPFRVLGLVTLLASASIVAPVSAQNLAQTSVAAGVAKGNPVPTAASVAVPAAVRRTLPRGAKTLFFVRTDFNKQTVFVHGWNPSKGSTIIEALTRSRRTYRRLSRATHPRIESDGGVRVRAALLDANTKKGVALFLNWLEDSEGVAETNLPRTVLTWPTGWSGSVYLQDLSTTSSPSGNVFYRFRRASDGRLALWLIDESFDGGTQTETFRFWNNAAHKFEVEGEPRTLPLSTENGYAKD